MMKGKIKDGKGFTLAELLIVVAIIAILIAILVPVFGASRNKAILEKDAANVRSALSEAIAEGMTDSTKFSGSTLSVTLERPAGLQSGVTVDNTTHVITVAYPSDSTTNKETITVDADVTVTLWEAETPSEP